MGWESVDMGDLTREQREILKDLQRHGTIGGVPSRTHSRLDLSRLDAFEGTMSIPDVNLAARQENTLPISETGIREAVEDYVRRQEAAILGTDWERWDIVDLVEWSPITPSDLPEFEVHRYEETAPPVSTYATWEQRYSVTRVTLPLLERVFRRLDEFEVIPERYEEFRETYL